MEWHVKSMICQVLNISKVEVSDDHPKKGSDIYDQLLSRKGGPKCFLGTIFWLGSKVFSRTCHKTCCYLDFDSRPQNFSGGLNISCKFCRFSEVNRILNLGFWRSKIEVDFCSSWGCRAFGYRYCMGCGAGTGMVWGYTVPVRRIYGPYPHPTRTVPVLQPYPGYAPIVRTHCTPLYRRPNCTQVYGHRAPDRA